MIAIDPEGMLLGKLSNGGAGSFLNASSSASDGSVGTLSVSGGSLMNGYGFVYGTVTGARVKQSIEARIRWTGAQCM